MGLYLSWLATSFVGIGVNKWKPGLIVPRGASRI